MTVPDGRYRYSFAVPRALVGLAVDVSVEMVGFCFKLISTTLPITCDGVFCLQGKKGSQCCRVCIHPGSDVRKEPDLHSLLRLKFSAVIRMAHPLVSSIATASGPSLMESV